jgi:hypothetical protein
MFSFSPAPRPFYICKHTRSRHLFHVDDIAIGLPKSAWPIANLRLSEVINVFKNSSLYRRRAGVARHSSLLGKVFPQLAQELPPSLFIKVVEKSLKQGQKGPSISMLLAIVLVTASAGSILRFGHEAPFTDALWLPNPLFH